MISIVNCGFVDNICHDYENGIMTPKWEIEQMVAPMTWDDQAKIVKWYNQAMTDGIGSLAHFKLCCIASDIIRRNWNMYLRHSLCPSVHWAWKY